MKRRVKYVDKYERTINLLNTYTKRWKELFDTYCEKVGDETKSDNIKATYADKASEAYTMYNELNAILNDILSLNDSEEES